MTLANDGYPEGDLAHAEWMAHLVDIADHETSPQPANGANGSGSVGPLLKIEAAALTTAQLKDLPAPEKLVATLLYRDTVAMLYGPSGGSKTFVASDLALHVATSTWWHGRETVPGPVIYVAAEGARGLGLRVDAWQDHHGVHRIERHHPVTWVARPVHLFETDWVDAFIEFARQRHPVLIVIDTVARCSVGADENSAKDMGRLVENADRVRRSTGACVLLVHHSGKALESGARGSSALRAAVDTEIECTSDEERVTLKVTKQKDAEPCNPIKFVRTPIAESCTLILDHGQGDSDTLTPAAVAALDTLRSIEVPGGISTSVWLRASELKDRTFYNARGRLLANGLVSNLGSDKRPAYMVTETVESDP